MALRWHGDYCMALVDREIQEKDHQPARIDTTPLTDKKELILGGHRSGATTYTMMTCCRSGLKTSELPLELRTHQATDST